MIEPIEPELLVKLRAAKLRMDAGGGTEEYRQLAKALPYLHRVTDLEAGTVRPMTEEECQRVQTLVEHGPEGAK